MNYRSITLFLLGVLTTLALTHNYSEAEGIDHAEFIKSPSITTHCFGIYNSNHRLVGGNCDGQVHE